MPSIQRFGYWKNFRSSMVPRPSPIGTTVTEHFELFGVCNVSSDFPHLHQWIADQKELFRLSRTGKEGINMMNASRLKMLMEIGVDFFTGECLPGTSSLIISKG